ncbi:MAG: AAA family ATPase [Planctomycetes bacterium]|nr:AAA family ATPase [Planctomycetota bacterium]
MKLTEVRIENFRSFKDETILFDDYTCLVGPNGSGKSAVLMSLNVFFRNNDSTVTDIVNLTKEDFHHENISEPIRLTLTFDNLSEEAQKDLKHYYRQGKLVVFAKAFWDESNQKAIVKQHGCRNVMKEFAPYFELLNSGALAGPLKKEFDRLRDERPDIPSANTKDTRTVALREYEEEHPELCNPIEEECQFYGFSRGKDKLDKYIQWVYVPAVKDASSEQEEGSKTALGQLLQRTVRAKIDFKDELAALEEEAEATYEKILEGKREALKDLGLAIQKSLRDWTNPRAAFELEWQGDIPKAKPPIAKAKVGEDAFIGEISRLGHGMQRGFLVAILKELVENEQKGGPKLLLGFEEPELYQHPPQAQHMLGVLEQLVKPQNNSQIIVTTHSPYFVSSKGFPNIRVFRKCGKRPYSVVKGTNYTKVKKRLTEAFGEETPSPTSLMAKVGQIMQTSQKELFFSPVVVLVEGVEDLAFIATHMQLTDEWKTFRRNRCHFVVADGKNNIPRLVAITQEFGIPTFVICDSDIEKSIEMLERAEKLQEGTPNRTEKIKSRKVTLQKHKEINKAIANLCGLKIEDPLICETIRGHNIVMWRDAIGTEVKRSFGAAEWEKARNESIIAYGFEGVNEKNGMVIAATLEQLHTKEKQSPVLIDLCGRISKYAQRVESRGRI